MSSADANENEALTAAKKKRLDKVFEHATKKISGSGEYDYDYVTKLLTECLTNDPLDLNYVRAYIENLQKKYKNNKKGSQWAVLKELGTRNALKKAFSQEKWLDVLQNGFKLLAANPWDVPTLQAMATAASKLQSWECEQYYLKTALVANPKDPETNRRYAKILTDAGQFDLAIACWRRVEEAEPDNEEARRAIAVLMVKRAKLPGAEDETEADKKKRFEKQKQEELTQEQKLLKKLEEEPNNIAHYHELAQFYITSDKFAEAEEILRRAVQIASDDQELIEKWEDVQLRHLRQKVAKAKDPEEKKKLQQQYFEKDVEIYQRRVERYPTQLGFRYELGYRYLIVKRYNDAIKELQLAKNDPRRKGVCLLLLGECFRHIKQYRLAMSHYEAAIEEIPDRDAENKKKALYLAGQLALALKDLETAEKHLTKLAELDFTYKDVSALLDKIASIRENTGLPTEQAGGESPPDST